MTMQFPFGLNKNAQGVVIVDPTTEQAQVPNRPQSYTLLNGATATGPAVAGVRGGDYIWRVEGKFSSGVTPALQYLGLDGATWLDMQVLPTGYAPTAQDYLWLRVTIAQGSTVRVALSGSQTSPLYSSIAGVT